MTADGPADRHPAAAPPGAAAASPQPAETRPAVRPALQPRGSSRYHFSLHSRPQRIPLPDWAHFQIVIVRPRLLWSSLAWRFITKSLQFYRKTASFHSLQELGRGGGGLLSLSHVWESTKKYGSEAVSGGRRGSGGGSANIWLRVLPLSLERHPCQS